MPLPAARLVALSALVGLLLSAPAPALASAPSPDPTAATSAAAGVAAGAPLRPSGSGTEPAEAAQPAAAAVAGAEPDAARPADDDTATSPLAAVTAAVRARDARRSGYTGRGIDVAVLDSGVVPVDGLRAPGKVVHGPDLSFDSGSSATRHLDAYGHGTHMAGIVAGRDDSDDSDGFTGVAPGARVVSVKVADATGATDVSQVIAGLDWLVEHGDDGDLDVRVVNLSFGTGGVQDYRLDPLAHAVERAWHAGIVVVVAAGNQGLGTALNDPAYDPYVLAVGGSDSRGTTRPDDDVVASWSSRGDASRHPDLVAPGQSVVSLRSPGSSLDTEHPGARLHGRFFRGSGTSQATAVVSGGVALLLQQRPDLTPDQVKALLTASARHLPLADELGQGAGLLDVRAALATATPTDARQDWPRAQGTGLLELARGHLRVSLDGVPLVGERSVLGAAWSPPATLESATWAGGGWQAGRWTGGSWRGNSWTGNSWTGNSWTGNSWTGNSWTGNSWTAEGQ